MTEHDLQTLDSLDSSDFMDGDLSDEELEIPLHMVPPNPDDADTLPSQVHPSYPYGNPTNLNHPAALPHIPGEPGRALYEDMGHPGAGANMALRWKDLALELLLPINEEKEEAERAALARKQAAVATQGNHASGMPQEQNVDDDDEDDSDGDEADGDEDEEEEEDDEEDDEDDENNDLSRGSMDSGMTGASSQNGIEYSP
ncbi:hypothetical protein M422DRAFT_72110 [Sphaerobolus stellatus SS14]|uniref:Unplaced genomic scaffold SPHSTscaffold_331, whole genome shotgun sequence n=1 Tax=Sphaerobolus stellatus (strain SS14) TaxID=990650 RepID=A0A0C9TUS9_SPHS4|nr:hypothetical protein M422DRAFT_72110 [Sphaerobolus stellatus SS14]